MNEVDQTIQSNIVVLEVRDICRLDSNPIAWLQVERVETFNNTETGEISSASIELRYKSLLPNSMNGIKHKGGRFCGGYNKYRNMVSITNKTITETYLSLDLPGLEGQHIGTYLMNEIIQWVKQWPEAAVNKVQLDVGQAGDSNKLRRNRFYEQFGIEFNYDDVNFKTGKSKPMLAGKLKVVTKWQANISEYKLFDFLSEVLTQNLGLKRELEYQERACAKLHSTLNKVEQRPKSIFSRFFG